MYLIFASLAYLFHILALIELCIVVWMIKGQVTFIQYINMMNGYSLEAVTITEPARLQSYSYPYVAFGAAMFLLSFLGYYAACAESVSCINMYSALVILIAFLQMLTACTVKEKNTQYNKLLGNLLLYTSMKYRENHTNPDVHNMVDKLHTDYKCCGAYNHSDFKDQPKNQTTLISKDDWRDKWVNESWIPASCCRRGYNCTMNHVEYNSNYKRGCLYVLERKLKLHRAMFWVLGIGLSTFELIMLILACCILCKTRDGLCGCGTCKKKCPLSACTSQVAPEPCRRIETRGNRLAACGSREAFSKIINFIRGKSKIKIEDEPCATKTKCVEVPSCDRVSSGLSCQNADQCGRQICQNVAQKCQCGSQTCKGGGCGCPTNQCQYSTKFVQVKPASCSDTTAQIPNQIILAPRGFNVHQGVLQREAQMSYHHEQMYMEQKLHHREQQLWDHEQFRRQQLIKWDDQFRFKVDHLLMEQDFDNRDEQMKTDHKEMLWQREIHQQNEKMAKAKTQLLLQRDYLIHQEDEASRQRCGIYNACFDNTVTCDGGMEFTMPKLAKKSPASCEFDAQRGSCCLDRDDQKNRRKQRRKSH